MLVKKNAENNVTTMKNGLVCKPIQTAVNGVSPDIEKSKVTPKVPKLEINNHGVEKSLFNDANNHENNPVEPNNLELKVPIHKDYQKSRLTSGSKSRHRDITTTQFAVADDDNVSAVQQITKGGGPALTLVSKWQYSFDDSEELNPDLENNSNLLTTDLHLKNGSIKLNSFSKSNDSRFVCFNSKEQWKSAHKEAYKAMEMHGKRRRPVRRSISQPAKIPPNLTVRNITYDDRKPKLLYIGVPISGHAPEGLPRCWSCPTISLHIRSHLKPPLKQQASFDENVYEVDIMRNVAAKQKLNEEIAPCSDERTSSLPYLNVAGTQAKEKPIQFTSHNESKIHEKSSDVAIKSLLSEINGAINEGKAPKEFTESNTQCFKPLKKSSSQKGILKKNSFDKSSFQYSNENKLQKSLSGPYEKWYKELTCGKQTDEFISTKDFPFDKINLCKLNGNVQNTDCLNDCFIQRTDHKNSVDVVEKKDLINGNSLNFSKMKNGNDAINKIKSVSLNTTTTKCYPSNNIVTFSPKNNDIKDVTDEGNTKKSFVALGKCNSAKDLKFYTNGIGDSTNSNSSLPQSQISRFNHARRSLTSVESVCIFDKKNASENLEDHQPSRIPVRFTSQKNLDINNIVYQNKSVSSFEKSNQKSVISSDKRRPRSLIIWQNTNSLGDRDNENCLPENYNVIGDRNDYNVIPVTSDQNNPTVDPTTTDNIQNTDEKTTVPRRRRANPECKYVKDESELKLNFVRRRQRPTSISSLSRIPRPCHNKPDRNSSFFGNSTDSVHSVCHKSALIDVDDGLNLQRVSSMPSVPLLSEKQLPIYFQEQKVKEEQFSEHTAISNIPRPPPGDPPPNHCLPSRFVAAF